MKKRTVVALVLALVMLVGLAPVSHAEVDKNMQLEVQATTAEMGGEMDEMPEMPEMDIK